MARISSEVWAFLAFLLAASSLLRCDPPAVDLKEVCDLQAVGRFGVECDLRKASAGQGSSWLLHSFSVFEDGLPLRDVSHSREVRKRGLGTYIIERESLTFSSIDGSSPLGNARRYEARAARDSDAYLSAPARWIAIGLGLLAMVASVRGGKVGPAQAAAAALIAWCLFAQSQQALQRQAVHIDAGSSLPTARDISEGAVPYRDILFNYTPLGVMTLAGWRKLWPLEGIAAHTWTLSLILLLECACAFQVFRICMAMGVPRSFARMTALSYLSTFLWFDGSRILLEPMYLLVALVALRSMIGMEPSRASWLAGGLASVGLLLKQYGGFSFWGALFASSFRPQPFKSAARVIAGSALVLAVLAGALLAAGVDVTAALIQTSGHDYAARREWGWIRLFFEGVPFLLLAPVLFVRREWRAQAGVMTLGAYLAASWMPLLIRQHQYYLQNPSPFLFIAFAVLASLVAARASARGGWLELVATICLIVLPVRAVWRINQASLPVRGAQERRAILMTDFWPARERVLMFAAPSFLALTGYRSPEPRLLGYRFLNESPLDHVRAGMRLATAAWLDPSSMHARGEFASRGTTLKEELVKAGFVYQLTLDDRFELWTKGGAPPTREIPASIEVD